ncbi:MAG: lipid asymmetry maintenance protein MlaB [Gammaproteobacteria bacterium]
MSGTFTVYNIMPIYQEGLALFKKSVGLFDLKFWILDLRELKQADSSLLAVLIDWKKVAEKGGMSFVLQHCPKFFSELLLAFNLKTLFISR